ncbi:MATE family efflux transporter [Amycolatopsis rubida]|uniref:Probable multidrug resistance protein NorM n=1 Tax=Amycolatopsis rubida TaxID=112413 RepID=A0ABX0BJY1_9PSEU|nr:MULTISPECIES: MATE family efflux transporter [Amycolatopsis]MYW90839.1 MATE family efflux transporter [Amycolatopsis rubida]NEC55822.1 MATE family efflux transporter [Amycolatopsis rubida]OAP26098.1 Multidrug resistance protein NorM [Amycolatopsis sp. M39]
MTFSAHGSAGRQLAALATPIVLTQLAQVALTTTDTVMMGLLGTEALAAGGLAVVLFNQLRTMGVGLVTAVGNQVATAEARAEAAGDPRSAQATITSAVRAGFVVATAAGVLGGAVMLSLGYALSWFGQDPGVLAGARPVLAALAPGLVPCLWFQVIRQFTVGMRRPQALVWITIGSVALNAGLDWAFVTGGAGLAALGLPGIGLATSIVHLLSFAALLLAARRDPILAPVLSLKRGRGPSGQPAVRRLLSLGVPIAATYGSEAGFFSVVALLIGSFGPAALAAHTVVNQLVYIVFQVSVGISHGASILVSRHRAHADRATAAKVARTALASGTVLAAAIAAVYLAAPTRLLQLFTAESSTVSAAIPLLAVAAVLQFADSAQNIGVGLLRGLDDTRGSFRISLIGYWAIGLPVAFLLGVPAGWGATGVWIGLATGLTATAALLLRRFAAGLHREA